MRRRSKIAAAVLVAVPMALCAAVLTDGGLNTNNVNTVGNSESSVALGIGNTVRAKSLAVGINNNVAVDPIFGTGSSFAVGDGNSVEATSGCVGSYNAGWGFDALIVGMGNYSGGATSLFAGTGNTDWLDGYNNMVLGVGNDVTGSQGCVVLGADNQVVQNSNIWIMGEGNSCSASSVGTVFLGTYSAAEVGASLVVGTGTDDLNRSNGLVVYKNGDVVLPKAQGDISMGIYE